MNEQAVKNIKSPKELALEERLLETLRPDKIDGEDLPQKIMSFLIKDEQIASIQNYANHVSIKRLGFNDHGPVHMRTVCKNCIKMLKLLHKAGIKTSLEDEEVGTFTDSLCGIIFASFLHDLGMSIGRQDHELYSMNIALPIIDRILLIVLEGDDYSVINRRMIIRSIALEGIVGHMGTHKIHSIEAGTILVGDGCDMSKGRARIPLVLNTEARQGDIHKYSANSIEKVHIKSGDDNKPICIEVLMSSEVGFFQIEEVLLPKINSSTIKPFISLYAGVEDEKLKQYL